MAGYNSYLHMEYGGDNVLTRIIDAVKERGLKTFTPAKVTALLKRRRRHSGTIGKGVHYLPNGRIQAYRPRQAIFRPRRAGCLRSR
jgi:hypothetical protein